jgi:predicted ATP-grasp superfamily ATP-dependent carboligase
MVIAPTPLRILVSQGAMKHSVGLVRQLARAGHTVYAIVDVDDQNPPVSYSRYCAGIFYADQRDEARFIEAVERIATRQPFDVFIPVGFPVTRFAARNVERLKAIVAVTAPPAELEALAEDKYAISERAKSLGVPTPHTIVVDSSRDLRAQLDGVIRLPLIIKGRGEVPKGIVVRVDAWGDERERVDAALQRCAPGSAGVPLVAQEYVPGWGCGFFATYDKGECKRVFMHRRIREYPPTGGASSCARSFRDPRLASHGRRLLDGLGWHGIAMAEFRFDERDHDFKLIEVNAKFWGSLELALAAGADFAADYVRLARGEPLDYRDDYDDLTFQWLLGGDLQLALRRPRKLFAVLGTALRPGVATDVTLGDPGLLAARLGRLLRSGARFVR